jgi:PAS domain S-box-containing protein
MPLQKLLRANSIVLNERAAEFASRHQLAVAKQTDRFFAILMPAQWVGALLAAYWLGALTGPLAWPGGVVLWGGGLLSLSTSALCLRRPGKVGTRYVVAVAQMLMSGLLIYLSGGRTETHFHIFGSLAFLAFYGDWRVLLLASAVTVSDHLVRGGMYPASLYGTLAGGEWRWLEHAAWVSFTDIFLIMACLKGSREIRQIAQRTAALNESEERYRAVVEQTQEGIVLIDHHAAVLECNEAFRKLLGFSSVQELKKQTPFEYDTAGRAAVMEIAAKVETSQTSIVSERQYRRCDGSLVEVEVTLSQLSYDGKQVFCCVVNDITERKQAEAELERLALIAQKTSNAVIVTGPQCEIQWVNDGFTRITGYRLDEVLGQKPGSFLQGVATDPETVAQIRAAIAERRQFDGEIYNYSKTGRGYWLSISITPILDDDGELQGFIAIEMESTERREMEEALRRAQIDLEMRVNARTAELQCANDLMLREVLDRKRAEEGLKEAQQFLRKVIDTDPNLICVKDHEGRFTLANQALADLYGTTVEELLGQTEADFNGNPAEVAFLLNDDRRVLETLEEKFIPEEKITDANGNTHWLQTVKRPLLSADGLAHHVIAISTDLTERRKLESQLRHAQKLESIGQLAAGIAHEINTPTQYVGDNTRFVREAFDEIVTVLERYQQLAEAARAGAIPAELIERVAAAAAAADLAYLSTEIPAALQQSLEGVARIARIVQSMKDFAHPGTAEKKAADLNKAIASTITVARNEWKYVADLQTQYDESLPLVPCLLGEFNQVILNVIINATHAIADVQRQGGPDRGQIKIETRNLNDQWAEVRISDSGTGIPPEVQSRVFDPFFTTKEVGKGTGQGLAISHSVVVEKHGGQFSFETEAGRGTTFIIRLPLQASEPESHHRSLAA